MSDDIFLGVDTSNYTTSISLIDGVGNLILNIKKMLTVPKKMHGLRQSEAVYQHVRNLIEISKDGKLDKYGRITAIGVSTKPRDSVESFMPCFMVGKENACFLASFLGIPVYSFSHQAGHIMAILYGSGNLEMANSEFLSFHISGGTTDAVYVKPDSENIFSIENIGGSSDLHAGQLIDRVGDLLQFEFPSGKMVDSMACSCDEQMNFPKVSVKGLFCNFSGFENKAFELYEKTKNKKLVSKYTMEAVYLTLACLTKELEKRYPGKQIVYSGGVMNSEYIKNRMESAFHIFSSEFACDNAVGIAELARERHYLGRKI